jgi:hypothetical protein
MASVSTTILYCFSVSNVKVNRGFARSRFLVSEKYVERYKIFFLEITVCYSFEQISYECEKSRHTARSGHGIEEICSTNQIARDHFSTNENARTRHRYGHGTVTVTAPLRSRHRYGHGTARPYREAFTVIQNLLYCTTCRS